MATVIAARVEENTAPNVNDRIRVETDKNIAFYLSLDRGAIDRRLVELDREWNVERMLETNAASVVIASFLLGAVSSRKWFALSAFVGCFLMQHAVQEWCPPPPILRHLGFRTAQEIEREREQLLRSRDKARL